MKLEAKIPKYSKTEWYPVEAWTPRTIRVKLPWDELMRKKLSPVVKTGEYELRDTA